MRGERAAGQAGAPRGGGAERRGAPGRHKVGRAGDRRLRALGRRRVRERAEPRGGLGKHGARAGRDGGRRERRVGRELGLGEVERVVGAARPEPALGERAERRLHLLLLAVARGQLAAVGRAVGVEGVEEEHDIGHVLALAAAQRGEVAEARARKGEELGEGRAHAQVRRRVVAVRLDQHVLGQRDAHGGGQAVRAQRHERQLALGARVGKKAEGGLGQLRGDDEGEVVEERRRRAEQRAHVLVHVGAAHVLVELLEARAHALGARPAHVRLLEEEVVAQVARADERAVDDGERADACARAPRGGGARGARLRAGRRAGARARPARGTRHCAPGRTRFLSTSVPVALPLSRQRLHRSSASCPCSPHMLRARGGGGRGRGRARRRRGR